MFGWYVFGSKYLQGGSLANCINGVITAKRPYKWRVTGAFWAPTYSGVGAPPCTKPRCLEAKGMGSDFFPPAARCCKTWRCGGRTVGAEWGDLYQQICQKDPWLFWFFFGRRWNNTTQLYGDYFINHCKDSHYTISISWKVRRKHFFSLFIYRWFRSVCPNPQFCVFFYHEGMIHLTWRIKCELCRFS